MQALVLLPGFLVGAIVAGVLRTIFRTPGSKQDWVSVIAFALLGGLTTQIALTNYQTNKFLYELQTSMSDQTTYKEARAAVENMPDQQTRDVFEQGIADLENQLHDIAEGRLRIDRNDVFRYWETLITNSEQHIQATNLVSSADWDFFGPGGAGIAPQVQAAGRGIPITRVMIYDPGVPEHQVGLRRTACHQLAQIPRLKVYEISVRRLQDPPYPGLLRNLNTPDIVIYDDKLLLTTRTLEGDRRIDWSVLTREEQMLQTAQEFFSRLLRDATQVDCSSDNAKEISSDEQ